MTDYANKDVYGNDSNGIRRLLVAKGAPAPAGVTLDSGDKTTDPAEAIGLPILGYDALTEGEVLEKLPTLNASDLAAVQSYERRTQGRSSVLSFGSSQHVESLGTTMPATAQAVDADQTVGEVQKAGKVIGVSYIPEAAITGADTDTRTVRLINKGQSGSGSTVVATLTFAAGVNGAAFDEKAIALSGTLANRNVAAGDVLAWESNHVGAGLADPGGRVSVQVAG